MQSIVMERKKEELIKDARELFTSGKVTTPGDIPNHFSTDEIALIADYLIQTFEQLREIQFSLDVKK
jgi:hypothetical protein